MRSRRVVGRVALLSCLLGLVLTAPATGQSPAAAADPPSADQVTVTGGALRGTVTADRRSFLGIPYAAPPTGDRRFRPPQVAASWSGTRDATKSGNNCPQAPVLGTPNEDCLVLDVHTPPVAKSVNVPVLVWFHGGGYLTGSAAAYDPAPLVTKGNVIVVGVNYRLGPLGFLALPGLAAESQTTGNYGILDQQAGLRWVQQNIRAFGGDPNNVTIFGESAGGHSVCMQLIAPAAKGLFDKAISESGGCVGTGTGKRAGLGPMPVAQAYATGNALAAAVGCGEAASAVACLRGKPAVDLLNAKTSSASMSPDWVPTIDGAVIKETTQAALKSGRYHKVPLLVGTNKDEGRLFLALQWHLGKLRSANATDLADWIRDQGGSVATDLLTRYPAASDQNADVALAAAMTDSTFACAAEAVAQSAEPSQPQAVYQYEFADPKAPFAGLDPFLSLGAYHGSELFSLFSTVMGIPFADALLADDQKKLSAQMISYWTNFARTGDPNGPGVPTWPALTPDSGQIQRLTPEGPAPFPASTFSTNHQCALWRKLAN